MTIVNIQLNPQQTAQFQQQNYLFWLADRGLADAPEAKEQSHSDTNQSSDVSPTPTPTQVLGTKKTQVHVCHILPSCADFKRRPREVQLFLKIAAALGLSKEHYIVADPQNLSQKMDMFDFKYFILWGAKLDSNTEIKNSLKTHALSDVLQSPNLKADVWAKIKSLKL